jgi:short chain dehydrogenase
MSDLKGTVAVVTGASKGIGAAIVKCLSAAGAAVVVNYSLSRDGAERVLADIKANGGKAIAVKGDVTNAADVRRLFAETKKAFHTLDVLVNNAGVYKFLPLAVRPLGVQCGLWPEFVLLGRREQRLLLFHRKPHIGTIDLGIGTGPRAAYLIDHVDPIASDKEVMRPTGPAIRRAHEIGAGLSGAMNHDDWIGMRQVMGRQVFHIHLPSHEPFVAALDILAADEEVAVLGERERRDGGLRSRWGTRTCD